eukprot:424189-Pelagomonas_calceolata.AAC.1
MGVWRITGSTRLQNLAVRSFVLNSTPSGIKSMSILNRMGMKFVSKFNGMLMVQSQLLELRSAVEGTHGSSEPIGLRVAAVPPSTVVGVKSTVTNRPVLRECGQEPL